MKKSALTLILFLAILSAGAQQKVIDSLRKRIAGEIDDTSKIVTAYQLSIAYLNSHPDSTLYLAQQMKALSQTAHFQKGEGMSLVLEGAGYAALGNNPKALSSALASLTIGEEMHDQAAIERSFTTLGMVYGSAADYRQSINFTLKALPFAKSLHDYVTEDALYITIGDDYEKLNILDSAAWYCGEGKKVAISHNFTAFISLCYNNLGNIYYKKNRIDSSLYYYRKAMPGEMRTKDNATFSETSLGLAKVFWQFKRVDSSIYYARQSIAVGRRGSFTAAVLNASQFLSNYFKQNKKIDSAFYYQDITIAVKDSLYNQEKIKKFQNLNFAERQRQQDIQEQQNADKARLRIYLLVIVIVFLMILALVFWRNSKHRKKANELLQSHNQEIEKQKKTAENALSELKVTQNQLVQSAKMASLGELTAGIAHEIQNPLNFVNNFSDVNREMLEELEQELDKGDINEAKTIAADIRQNEEKINHHGKRADSIVKGMLQHSRVSTGQKEPVDLNKLIDEYLRLAYNGLKAQDKEYNAELVTKFDAGLPKVNIIPQDIGRVILNLLNNAFYAVNEKAKTAGNDYKPTVEVETFFLPLQGVGGLKVKDNGVGIPESIREKIMQPFFTTKPPGEGTGLGLSLSYDIIVTGHGGYIEVNTKEGEFTAFTVTLPV